MPARTHYVCTVDGCEKAHYAKALCVMHYSRLRIHGDVNHTKLSRADEPRFCEIEGCGRPYVALGYCKRHHRAFKKHGNPTAKAGPRGGRMVTPEGYVRVKIYEPDPMVSMRDSSGYVPEHRLVMARAIGRPLTTGETVHHINAVRGDNRLENLQLRLGHHGSGAVFVCNSCGSRDVEARPL